MLARQTSVLSPLAGAMQLTGSARGSLIVFAMKNAEGVFPSLPARNERGESWREGKLMKNGLLSPALSSFGEGEGEGKRRCARGKLLAKQVLAARVLSPFAKKSFPI